MDGAEIQGAVEALDRLVEEAGIPDKISLIHQFELSIVTDRQLIEATENLQVVLNVDGFGLAEQKTTKYELLVGDGPIQYGGFKLLNRQLQHLLWRRRCWTWSHAGRSQLPVAKPTKGDAREARPMRS